MSTEGSKKTRSSNFLSFVVLKGDYLEEIIMGEVQGVSLPLFREYSDQQQALRREDLFYRIPNGLPALSDGLRTTATTAYTTSATATNSNDPLARFLERAATEERGLPAHVYPREGYNIGPAGYAGAQLSFYTDELGNIQPLVLGQGGLALVAHQTPALWTWYIGAAGGFSGSGDSNPDYTNGGHVFRGYIQTGGSFNLIGIPDLIFKDYKVPHNELINGVFVELFGGYGTGGSRAYSDSMYIAPTAMGSLNLCLVGLDETAGLCLGSTFLADYYNVTRDDGNTYSGWIPKFSSTIGFRTYFGLGDHGAIPIESRIDRPVNADIPNEPVVLTVVGDEYSGELSNALRFTVVDYDPSHYEYIVKTAKDEDTDGVAEGLFHDPNGMNNEDAEKVRHATIVFSYQGQDLKFEDVRAGSPGAGTANATSALFREVTLHAGANWTEWFVYKGFVYQVVMNTEPEKLVIQSFPVEEGSPYAGKEEAVIFRGTAKPVQRR